MRMIILLFILSFSDQAFADQVETIPLDVAQIACFRIHSKITGEDLKRCIKRLQGSNLSKQETESKNKEQ